MNPQPDSGGLHFFKDHVAGANRGIYLHHVKMMRMASRHDDGYRANPEQTVEPGVITLPQYLAVRPPGFELGHLRNSKRGNQIKHVVLVTALDKLVARESRCSVALPSI